MKMVIAALLVLTSSASSQLLLVPKGPPRTFVGRVVAEWLPDGRKMRLLEDFGYYDDRGLRWDAPKGSIVDGASIPRIAWTPVGGPFEGLYRYASVIHDVACDQKDRPWQAVHEVFYSAMLAAGEDPLRAKVMYGAVYHFGPRWPLADRLQQYGSDPLVKEPPAPVLPETEENYRLLKAEIERLDRMKAAGVSLAEIRQIRLPQQF